MAKPRKAGKINSELQREIETRQREGTLDTMLSGVIRFAQNTDYQRKLDGFVCHYHGFKVVTSGEITVFESPAKYIADIAKHEKVVEIRSPTELYPIS